LSKYSYSSVYRNVMTLFGGDAMNMEATYLLEFFTLTYGALLHFTISLLDLIARIYK